MTESLSLFDLIAAVDAMTFRGPVARPMSEDKRGQSGVPRCHEGASVDDEPPTAIVMPYEYAESFALRNECDSFTVYEVEGFGVGKGAIFDFIIEDNARLRKIFDLYDLRLQNESGQSVLTGQRCRTRFSCPRSRFLCRMLSACNSAHTRHHSHRKQHNIMRQMCHILPNCFFLFFPALAAVAQFIKTG